MKKVAKVRWRVGRPLAGLLVTLMLAASGAAQDAGAPVTLSRAVEIALAGHPSVRGADAGRALADAAIDEARAGRTPKIGAGERITNSNNPVFVFGTLLEQGRFGPENFAVDALNNPDPTTNFRTSIDLSMPVFDQRQSGSRLDRARIAREQADARRESVAQRIRFNVIRAYYGVLVARAEKEVADEAVRSAESDVARLRSLFDEGIVVLSDPLAVEVQLAEFRQQQIEAEGAIAVAYAALDAALGLMEDGPRQLTGTLSERVFESPSAGELVRTALEERPDYRATQLEVRARDASIRSAKGEYLPRVDAFVSAGTSSYGFADASTDYAAGVSITYSIFDAGRRARVDAALANRDAADAEREEKASAIRLEVVEAYETFVAARARLEVAARAIDQAAETLRIVRNRHGAGLTAITEVLRAQTALVRAKTSLVRARYAYTVGYAGTLLASGRLRDAAPFDR